MAKPPPFVMDSNGRLVYTPSGDREWEPTLTPGAYLAKQRGCTCSRLDNWWGEGTILTDGDTEFLIQPGCPLHDIGEREQDERGEASDTSSRELPNSGN